MHRRSLLSRFGAATLAATAGSTSSPTSLVLDGDKHRPDDVPSGSQEVLFEVPATLADRTAIRVRFRGLACDAHLADSCRSFSFDVPAGERVTHRHSMGTFRDPERATLTREVTADARAFWHEVA